MVLGDDGYFPVVYAKNGNPAGILPAILERASAITGDRYEVHLSPRKRAYELAVQGEGVDKAIAAGMFVVERDVGQAGRLRKLLADRLDAAFIGNGVVGFEGVINSQDELQSNRAQFAILPTPLTRDPLHLVFAKSMKKRAALDRFDAALEKLRKSGDLKKLTVVAK